MADQPETDRRRINHYNQLLIITLTDYQVELTYTFIRIFLLGLYAFAPLLLSLAFAILLIGQIVRKLEGWSWFDAVYWSLITASTVGYGDFRPTRRWSKALSVVIAMIGLIFTGIIVGIAVNAASVSFVGYADMDHLKVKLESIQ